MDLRYRKWLLVGLLFLPLFLGLAYGVSAQEEGVDVQQAYFVAAAPSGADLNLTASLFVTNHALTRSDDLSVTAFVVPTHSGLAVYTTRVDLGSVGGRFTKQVDIPLTIPQFNATRSYRIDFLVFDDGLLTQRGQGSIGWGGHYAYDAVHKDSVAVAEGLQAHEPVFDRLR